MDNLLNKIHFADCLEVLRQIPDGSVDLMLTDPPYNTTACEWEYEIDLNAMWNEWERVISDNGVLAIFADEPFTSKLILSRLGFFKYRITWDKMIGSNFLNAHKMPLKQTEDVVLFSKVKNGNYTYNPILLDKPKKNIRPIGNRKPVAKTTYGEHNGKCSEDYDNTKSHPSNLLSLCAKERECNSINRTHPTQKPIDLFRYLIRTYSNPGDVVFDGYGGSGTTAIAAQMENRKFIVCENHLPYFESSTARLSKLVAAPYLFSDCG